MADLTDKQKIDYLLRGFTAVDGLWCMKVEDRYGFDTALEIDDDVWKILPKILARKMKELKKAGNGIDALCDCFSERMKIEGMSYKIEKKPGAFDLIIDECPWVDVMRKSSRGHLASSVGSTICPSDYSGWANEFGCKFHLDSKERICNGSKVCVLHFSDQ
jgi:hypothetical protein